MTNIDFASRFTVLKALHKEYGHVVRLSPQGISVSDKALIKQILVTDDLKKEPFYDSVSSKLLYYHSIRIIDIKINIQL
jgi:hypothetical protein